MTDFHVRRATPADAARLADLAEKIFRETFEAQNRPEDIEDYLGKTYGEPHQRRELENEDITTLVIENGDGFAGFVQMRSGVERPGIEIARFYIHHQYHGKGLSVVLMKASEEAARERGAKTLWLGVWECNARAIAFYEKCGFRDVGSHPFLLGTDLQTDRLMEKEL
jgi:ribosomal protein S18 acetylase RimI-like enzyme